MEAKEKAIELMEKIKPLTFGWSHSKYSNECKEMALIAVDEIILTCININELYKMNDSDLTVQPLDYWNEVKQEINNLTI